MRVSVLGPLTADAVDGSLGPRDRIVLSALALECREVVGGARLADALWGDEAPASWNKVVQGCVVRLRRALGSATIETHPLGYRLTLTDDDLDTRRFEHQLRRARELLALGEPERAMYTADEALALWRGQPFIDVDHWEPAQVEAHRLSELHLDAEELRVDAALRAGRHREVLASARACVEAAPTRERRWELLALAQYRAGQQGDALRTLREARAVLVREIGVDPGPEMLALEQAILLQDERLAPPEVPAETSGSCPWPGLLAYGVDDAEEFFGRDVEVAACVERLTNSNVVVVVGPSGSGKSSLVRAGVAAALRRSGRRVVVVTPGAHPVDALTALPANGERPVLVVDQCEEAIVACSDPDERDAFFEALIAHAAEAPLVIALRADHVGDFSGHENIARLVERGVFLLGPMSETDLRAAIEGPARRAALLLEPGLVDLVVRDVLDEPGALPLMSHALRQTWAGRQGRTLTVAAYRETGGIRGAVAQSAEAVYENIDASERPKLRELLLRLVSPVENGEPTRARVPRHSLADDAGYAALVERLVAARLLTSDGDAVELAHEALARAWPRLKDWLDEDVDGLRVFRHVTTAAHGWDVLGRPDTELYRGVRLAEAVAWRERTQPELTRVERSFLERSVEVEAADLLTAQAQITRERRSVRRLRRLVVGVAVFAAIAIVASLVAFHQRDRADVESRVAAARRLSAEALVARPHDRALLLAVEALRLWDSDETRGNLLTTIGRSPRVAGVMRGRGQRLLDLEPHPTGRTAAVADGAGAVTLYDMTTRGEVGVLEREGSFIQAPTFSPDGDVVTVSRQLNSCHFGQHCEASVDVFGAADLQPRDVSYEGLGSVAADLEYSPDGTLLAAVPHFAWAGATDNIAIWRVDQPDAPFRRLTLPNLGVDLRESPDLGPPGWLAFSPDGTQLYASGAGPTTVFDVASGQAIRSFDGLGAMALSPDGRTIAIATAETSVQLVDTASGVVRAELVGHDALITSATFSSDGMRIATTSNDETVAVWDAKTGEQLDVLRGHAGSVLDVAFSKDGSTLFSSGADRSVFMWDVEGLSGLARTVTGPLLDVQSPTAVLVSPTADTVAVVEERVHVIDLDTGRVVAVPTGASVAWAAYHPDGRTLVTAKFDGTTELWRVADGQLLATRAGRGAGNFGAVAFATDGSYVARADDDGTVVALDARTLEPTGQEVEVGIVPAGIRTAPGGVFAVLNESSDFTAGTDIVFGDLDDGRVLSKVHIASWGPRANFNHDGSRYAVGGFDGRLGVIDVATGNYRGLRDPVHDGPISWVAFSPDDSTLASMGFDGDLTLSEPSNAIPRARVQPGPANTGGSIGYDPDGHTVLVAYPNGTALAYETDPAAWVQRACEVAGRSLTEDAWRDAFGDAPRRDTCPLPG